MNDKQLAIPLEDVVVDVVEIETENLQQDNSDEQSTKQQ